MRFLRLLHAAALTVSLLGLTAYVACIGTPVAQAQADLGSCSGVVTDASGAVIPNAEVKLTNIATGAVRVSATNSKGEYSVNQLLPATYSVSFSSPGFTPASHNLQITVGSSNTINVKLAVAGGSTQITVAADDFAGVHLEKPEVAAVIQTDQILSLPTLDRNPYSLVAFSGNLSSDPTATARGVGFNISGSRNTSVDILLDGVENTDLYAVGIGQTVPMDATSEIRIVTSNSGAEYGRGSGAVNVSTKSGTNGLHGSAYEFNRVSTLASDGYNNNYLHAVDPTTPAKPRYTHNQFGYSIGGPIKKDKIFFFSSTEWTRIRSAQNIITTVPTTDLIGMSASNMQDFFAAYGTLAHPINGTELTGAQVQGSLWGSDINYIGLTQAGLPTNTKLSGGCADAKISNTAICTKNLFGQSIYQIPADSGGGTPVNQWISFNRADWTINQTSSMFVRYIQESLVNPSGSVNNSPYKGYDTANTQFNHGLEVAYSKAITPTLASATKLLGSRYNNAQPLGTQPVSPTLYVNGGSPVTLNGGYINFPGYSQTSPGNALPFGGPQNFIEIGEDLAWSKGKHQFTFGGTFLYIKDNRTFGAYEEAVDGLINASSGATNALKNFVSGGLGLLQVAVNPNGAYPCYRNAQGTYQETSACDVTLPVSSPNFSRSNRYQDGAAYASDSWKVDPKLTVNVGVRWELYGPQHSQKPGYDANFFFGAGGTPWDQIRNGQVLTRNTAPNGRLWNLNTKQFAPKLGFAYDPFGTGKTSFRGGFGMNYERNFNNVTFNVIQNPPNYGVVSFTTADNGGVPIPVSTNNFAQFGTGTGKKLLPNVTLRAVDPKIKPAYAENWSLSIEHQFADTTASLSYVGTRGIHNYSISNVNRSFDGAVYEGDQIVNTLDLNSPIYGTAANLYSSTGNRTNYQYGSVNFRGADGDSYYHGLTAELRTANLMHTGLNVRADYTFSHAIDNDSSTFNDSGNEGGGGLVLGYTDPWNHALDRGTSDFNQKHRVSSAIVWNVPFGKSLTGVAKTLGQNWTVSTTFDAQTGTPFSMFDCGYAITVCPRTSFVTAPRRKGSNLTDISSSVGPNTYSYIHLPDYGDAYNEQVNPVANAYYESIYDPAYGAPAGTMWAGSDVPVCSGIHGVGCHLVEGMDGRNMFTGPGSWHENLGVVKDFKVHERYDLQLKGEFINIFNHANTFLNLGGSNDVSSYTDVLAYKSGNRNTELSLHIAF
ncbi:carboxypeptidase regulatory-like domain-containing protein [Telmatobacter sp. DSM 110680]|uniref:Carboxypeptidase regulatory-like domain-containing protein n=1 Tax=Telmatobacter sp. DSM 110680 TaxID=3036704 RepID=A0AAU7DKR7_9BACT